MVVHQLVAGLVVLDLMLLLDSISVHIEPSLREALRIEKHLHSHLLQAQQALTLLLSKLVGRPGIESYPARPTQDDSCDCCHSMYMYKITVYTEKKNT